MIFMSPPSDYKKQIDVVGCYIIHDGKFVLLQRLPHKANGNTWGLPAGKVDSGETLSQTALREVQEETGISILERDLKFFNSVHVRHNSFDLDWHSFYVHFDKQPLITVNSSEHQNYIWVNPAESLKMNLIHDLDECIRMFCNKGLLLPQAA